MKKRGMQGGAGQGAGSSAGDSVVDQAREQAGLSPVSCGQAPGGCEVWWQDGGFRLLGAQRLETQG